MSDLRPTWALVTPALAAANNGNWQTAARWARLLRPWIQVQVMAAWSPAGELSGSAPKQPLAGLIALHARRSAASVAAWRKAHPSRPVVLVLTGTDLYRDLPTDAAALQSLDLADHIVVLNELAPHSVPPAHRHKVSVCLQSCSLRQARRDHPRQHLRAVVVGHLRDEKSPRTVFAAARVLEAQGRRDVRIDHIGGALDAALGAEAERTMRTCPAYRWLGDRPHAEVRRRIQADHLLVHPSRMEGGAHVVIEAVRSGTAVLASAIEGNLGLLGQDWPACFAVDDHQTLVALLVRARDEPGWLSMLAARAHALSPRFDPQLEADCLRQVLARAESQAGCRAVRPAEARPARTGVC